MQWETDAMPVELVAYREEWPTQFGLIADQLWKALANVASAQVEHVGSTAVPGLLAKPILDIDVIVDARAVPRAVVALEAIGYRHRGHLGLVGREAFYPPDNDPRRNVYVCEAGSLNVRNHLAVRDVLRERDDLRDQYAEVKSLLARDPAMDINTYIEGKTDVLQLVLAESPLLTPAERRQVERLNRGLSGVAQTSNAP
jgi:GrpB-like predicted nucleotidyltransferase (UPF0157 family)